MADLKDLLAAERTLLAWIRTGIALMGFGFVVARFGLFLRELAVASGQPATQRLDGGLIGSLLVAAGVILNGWASLRHRQMVRRLQAGVHEVSVTGPVIVGVASGVGGLILIGVLLNAVFR